jgi:F-type H+-transporting ATPase subunit alpha
VPDVRRYEEELYRFVGTRHPELLKTIAAKKTLDDALKAEVTTALKEFGETFTSARAA